MTKLNAHHSHTVTIVKSHIFHIVTHRQIKHLPHRLTFMYAMFLTQLYMHVVPFLNIRGMFLSDPTIVISSFFTIIKSD